MALQPGARLGPYEILAPLGAGGMGEVYRARDPRLGREVAVKVLPAELAGEPSRLHRFQQEARTLAAVDHPNLLAIFDVGEHAGHPFLVSELLTGETLRELLLRGPLAVGRALEVAVQIARGLAAAHERGIVHRDLKPENVFLTKAGRVKILDFGLAKVSAPGAGARDLAVATATATQPGVLMGTVGYMAPEQVSGEPADARSDLFALGCILYELLTGRRAFQRDTAVETLAAILKDEAPRIGDGVAEVPPPVEHIVRRCLEKSPEQRFHSAYDLAFHLEEALAGGAATGRHRVARPANRGRFLAALMAAAAIALLGFWWARRSPPGAELPAARPRSDSIAVLPLENLTGQSDLDYLRLALPDTIATTLSRTPALAVRPFSRSRSLGQQNPDPAEAGRELRASVVVTGHLLLDRANLRLALEAFDVAGDRVLWREALAVERDDLLELEREVTGRLDRGLLPALGLASAGAAPPTVPRSPEAYELYLRALALPYAEPRALELLERSVALDPSYAPAWAELGWRQYQDAHWGAGGQAAYRRAEDAYQRALTLDQSLIEAAAGLAYRWTEAGRLEAAFDTAAALVDRRPDSAIAHSVMAYVLRYGGLTERASRECETALGLDPHESRVGLCAWVFLDREDYAGARRYTRMREDSDWQDYVELHVLLHEGRNSEALPLAARLAADPAWGTGFIEACLRGRPGPELAKLLEDYLSTSAREVVDGDASFKTAALAAFCDQPAAALGLLRNAVRRGFCSTTALDADPLLETVRGDPAFSEIRAESSTCQDRFVAYSSSRRAANP